MIVPAAPGMERELKRLWLISFQEESRPISLFFRMVYRPQNCLVYLFHGKVASAVHLLPCSVQLGGGRTAQAHYIYAAATFPEYRGKGLMASLLAYAALYGAAHGQTYSLVLPASDSLYAFYEAAGYLPFFQLDMQTASAHELSAFSSPSKQKVRQVPAFAQLTRVRNNVLRNRTGSALWTADALFYAERSARLYGGGLLSAGSSAAPSYALCSVGKECVVTEWIAKPSDRPALLRLLLDRVPSKSYRFRFPAGMQPPVPDLPVQRQPFGLIKPLSCAELPAVETNALPYLGMTLD